MFEEYEYCIGIGIFACTGIAKNWPAAGEGIGILGAIFNWAEEAASLDYIWGYYIYYCCC